MIRQVGYSIKFLRRYYSQEHIWSLFQSQWWEEQERITRVVVRHKVWNQKFVFQNWFQCNNFPFLYQKGHFLWQQKWCHFVGESRICWISIPILGYFWCFQPNHFVAVFWFPFYVHICKICFRKLHFNASKFEWIETDIQSWRIATNWIQQYSWWDTSWPSTEQWMPPSISLLHILKLGRFPSFVPLIWLRNSNCHESAENSLYFKSCNISLHSEMILSWTKSGVPEFSTGPNHSNSLIWSVESKAWVACKIPSCQPLHSSGRNAITLHQQE